jgi:hypothetical protein
MHTYMKCGFSRAWRGEVETRLDDVADYSGTHCSAWTSLLLHTHAVSPFSVSTVSRPKSRLVVSLCLSAINLFSTMGRCHLQRTLPTSKHLPSHRRNNRRSASPLASVLWDQCSVCAHVLHLTNRGCTSCDHSRSLCCGHSVL